jgi:predicted RNA-binding protein associated with RNAse of E/G family
MPDAWHDIGRFHLSDGSFTGIYANIITPCEFRTATRWHTTDWFLDVWIDPLGKVSMLDASEFEEAIRRGWVDEPTEARVREEAARLIKGAEAGTWPPPFVHEWTRERAWKTLRGP